MSKECPARLRLLPPPKPSPVVLESSGVKPAPNAARKHLGTIKRAAEALLDCRDMDLRAALTGARGVDALELVEQVESAIAQLRQAAGRVRG